MHPLQVGAEVVCSWPDLLFASAVVNIAEVGLPQCMFFMHGSQVALQVILRSKASVFADAFRIRASERLCVSKLVLPETDGLVKGILHESKGRGRT